MAKESIREFILEKFPLAKSRGLDDTTALLEEGVVDSLGILEIVNFLESDLGVAVEDDDLVPENFGSVQAIADFAQSRTAAKHTS